MKFAAVWQKKKKGGKFNGQRSLVGYSPWSHKELDRTAPAHWGKKKINSLVAFPQCLNIQQWTFSDSCPPLAYCGRLGNLSPQSVAVKNFLFLHYTEKKTASEVTVDKAQSLFWRADLVYKPRYSTHLFLHGF